MFRGQVGLSFLRLAGAGKVWPILVNNQQLLNSFETTKCCLNIYQHTCCGMQWFMVCNLLMGQVCQLRTPRGNSADAVCWPCVNLCLYDLWFILFSFLFPFSFVCSLLLKWAGWDILPAVLENWNQVVSPPALTSLGHSQRGVSYCFQD